MTVNEQSIIGDILKERPDAAGIFAENGMPCLGCPSSLKENIEQACYVHGMDTAPLLEKLNAFLGSCGDE